MKLIPPSAAILVAILAMASPVLYAAPATSRDSGTAASLREAVKHLAEFHRDAYPRGAEFLRRIDALGSNPAPEALAALRREALLANPLLDFDRILLIELEARVPGLPQNWQGNCQLPRGEVANRIAVLRDIRGKPVLETVRDAPHQKLVTDIDLHPDAQRILFSSIGERGRWQVFEMTLDGSSPKALPLIDEPDVDNYDACYLPDGNILFASTSTFSGVPCVAGSSHVANFHRYVPATGEIRRLTFDQEHNWNPAVLSALRAPSIIEPAWHAPVRGFNFAREVQPVLDRHCVQCHGGEEGHAEPYLKGDRMIDDWSSQIAGNAGKHGGKFSASYAELHLYVRRPGIESDMRVLSPMDCHSSTTELGKLRRDGHHGVKLDRESFERIVTWTEITGKPNVAAQLARANDLRRRYAPSGPVPDYETIPELPRDDKTPVIATPAPVAEQKPPSIEIKPATLETKTLDLGAGVAMEFIKVPGGRFDGREVAPFWIGKTEVTNAQIRRYLANHDSRDEARHGYQFGRRGYDTNSDAQPAVRVSWSDARAFARWLGKSHDVSADLPDGSQWEWACRAGTGTAFPFGDVDADYSKHANLGDITLREFAACTARQSYHAAEPITNPSRYDDWIPRDHRFQDGSLVTARAGSYQPNTWGIHDMIGNAWEWTTETTPDGRPIARGGSWRDRPRFATASSRVAYAPYQRVFNVGLRVVLVEGR